MEWIKYALVAVLGLPVVVYLVVKFAAAAYFRERQKHNEKEKQNEIE